MYLAYFGEKFVNKLNNVTLLYILERVGESVVLQICILCSFENKIVNDELSQFEENSVLCLLYAKYKISIKRKKQLHN